MEDGSRQQVYCRRYWYKNHTERPECYCLSSYCVSFSLFSQVLDIVELKFSEGDRNVYNFLHSVLAQPFPDPGNTIVIKTFSVPEREEDEGQEIKSQTFRITRSCEDYEYLEYVSYEDLVRVMGIDYLMLIFKAILLERHVILVSGDLEKLSGCLAAMFNLAYPFTWKYVYIPILPHSMLEILNAPIPYLIGILSSSLPELDYSLLEEDVLLIDLDNVEILRPPSAQPDFLPTAISDSLVRNLNLVIRSGRRHALFSISVARCFLRFFVSIFKHYHKYFERLDENGHMTGRNKINTPEWIDLFSGEPNNFDWAFNYDRFIRYKSSEIKNFMSYFKQTQLFLSFLQERELWAKKGILYSCALLRNTRSQLKQKIEEVEQTSPPPAVPKHKKKSLFGGLTSKIQFILQRQNELPASLVLNPKKKKTSPEPTYSTIPSDSYQSDSQDPSSTANSKQSELFRPNSNFQNSLDYLTYTESGNSYYHSFTTSISPVSEFVLGSSTSLPNIYYNTNDGTTNSDKNANFSNGSLSY
ncbi:DENN domain-containing protein 2C-like isoform X2 [Schistocerca gregaria]|nr:DENN domain-containing protein 2C-like isoform X2 [Schistocerca gregaria]